MKAIVLEREDKAVLLWDMKISKFKLVPTFFFLRIQNVFNHLCFCFLAALVKFERTLTISL